MDLESLNARLTRLEDLEAIKRVKYKYFFNCDNKNPSAVRECYIDGPMDIDFGRVGSFDNADDLVAIFSKLACAEHIVEMHHAQNPQIDIESATTASGIWGLYYYLIDTKQNVTTQLAGFYEDRYTKVEGEWKISATRYTVTSSQILSMQDDRVVPIFAGKTAPSALDDPSKQAG